MQLPIQIIATEEKWNKMSKEFISKACKSFQRCIDIKIKKMSAILSKFTILYLSYYFVIYFLESFIIILEYS